MTQDELKMVLDALEDRTSLMKWQIARDAVKEALAQPEQEPVAWMLIQGRHEELSHWPLDDGEISRGWEQYPLYTTPPQPEERNFCSRCGKRTADLTVIHTCTPPQEKNT